MQTIILIGILEYWNIGMESKDDNHTFVLESINRLVQRVEELEQEHREQRRVIRSLRRRLREVNDELYHHENDLETLFTDVYSSPRERPRKVSKSMKT